MSAFTISQKYSFIYSFVYSYKRKERRKGGEASTGALVQRLEIYILEPK